jgi:hypothetical protein
MRHPTRYATLTAVFAALVQVKSALQVLARITTLDVTVLYDAAIGIGLRPAKARAAALGRLQN